jgi:hypothetical protein
MSLVCYLQSYCLNHSKWFQSATANHVCFSWLYVCFYSELNCPCTDYYRRTLTCHSWFWPVIVVSYRLIYFQVCSKCGEGGANVCCVQRGCEWCLHYGCARQQGWELDEEAYIARCTQHKVSYWRIEVSCCIVFCIGIGKVFQGTESRHMWMYTILWMGNKAYFEQWSGIEKLKVFTDKVQIRSVNCFLILCNMFLHLCVMNWKEFWICRYEISRKWN